jgi:hypothetical protein
MKKAEELAKTQRDSTEAAMSHEYFLRTELMLDSISHNGSLIRPMWRGPKPDMSSK